MKVKDFDLLLTAIEEVVAGMKDRGDHYEYVGSMNNVERLREHMHAARYDYDIQRFKAAGIEEEITP